MLFALSYWFFEKSGKFPPEVETKYITNTVVKQASPSVTPSATVEKKEPTAKEYLKVPWVTYKSNTFKFSIMYPYNMPATAVTGEILKGFPSESLSLNGSRKFSGIKPTISIYGNFLGGLCHDSPPGSCEEEEITISGKKGSKMTKNVVGEKNNITWYLFDGPKELEKGERTNNIVLLISFGDENSEKELANKILSTLEFFN